MNDCMTEGTGVYQHQVYKYMLTDNSKETGLCVVYPPDDSEKPSVVLADTSSQIRITLI